MAAVLKLVRGLFDGLELHCDEDEATLPWSITLGTISIEPNSQPEERDFILYAHHRYDHVISFGEHPKEIFLGFTSTSYERKEIWADENGISNVDQHGLRIDSVSKNDWCHLCGFRSLATFVQFDLPENAEHSTADRSRGYVRLCKRCVERMVEEAKRPYHLDYQ